MSFLIELINRVDDADWKEELHERVAIVLHKLKFTERVSVCFGWQGQPMDDRWKTMLEMAGGTWKADPEEAKVLVVYAEKSSLPELMGDALTKLNKEWPSVVYNRVYLFAPTADALGEAEKWVVWLEDIAEMIHPGYFVFGNEGRNWLLFSV